MACKPCSTRGARRYLPPHLAVTCTVAALLAIPQTAAAKPRLKSAAAVSIGKKTTVDAKPKQSSRLRLAAKSPSVAEANDGTPAERATDATKPLQVLSREELLASDRDRLERVGRHIVVGFHRFADVRALVEKRAIAGIFITDHNVRNRTAAEIKREIDALQVLRAEQSLPPLIVAADQEGGSVSRLSPPLKRQMSLGRLLKTLPHDAERRAAVEDYAQTQADELQRIGVTLNFAPVVDLKLNPNFRDDGETRLRLRAISNDPYLVAKVAGWYCDTVAARGLMCTLKHFPGLGRVARDTHVASGEIAASEGQLELNDWVPFRRAMTKPNAATMLGHVRVGVIDKAVPASYSKIVIGDLIRKQWAHDGLLITDDFSMGAITASKSGVGGAAVKSIAAGTDLVLVSFLEKHYNAVMSALLAADAAGDLDPKTLTASAERIARVTRAVADTTAKPSP